MHILRIATIVIVATQATQTFAQSAKLNPNYAQEAYLSCAIDELATIVAAFKDARGEHLLDVALDRCEDELWDYTWSNIPDGVFAWKAQAMIDSRAIALKEELRTEARADLLAAIKSRNAPQKKEWSPNEICQVAVQTYFFLPSKPKPGVTVQNHYVFTSQAGNNYSCSLIGKHVSLLWYDDFGNEMTSKSTSYTEENGVLTIKTDMSEKTFTD